jgi:hypothetical protein
VIWQHSSQKASRGDVTSPTQNHDFKKQNLDFMKRKAYFESRNTENAIQNPKEEENARWHLERNRRGQHYPPCS